MTYKNNFRFAGQYYDQETGLHYNYHRYYDPKTGRYLTPDPIGLEGGINLYSYVLNNPVNAFDPFGLIWVTIGRDREFDKPSNWGTFILNRLNSLIGSGMEKGLSPEDAERWEQYLIQEWQEDYDNPCKDRAHTIGARRKIKQTFRRKTPGQGEELWDINTSHYWEPQVPSPTYQEYPGVRIEGDLLFYGTGAGDIP